MGTGVNRAHQEHPFEPVFSPQSRILILGTFPSERSRAEGFYYGHPRNRFWKVLAAIYGEPFPETVPERRDLILRHDLALWDVLRSCEISRSSDASIRNALPNDIPSLAAAARITRVIANGRTAADLYLRAGFTLPMQTLPSTSPANAAWTLERLIDTWGAALTACESGESL